MTDSMIFGVAAVASITAGVIDARSGRIPNWLTLPLAVGGLAIQASGGWRGLVQSLLGLILAGAVPWLFHRLTAGRAIGGGDVKLFAGLGALMGPFLGLEIELSAFVLLGVFALVRLAFAGDLLRVLGNVARLLANPFLPLRWRSPIGALALTEMRLGPAIALGVVSVAFRTFAQRWVPWLG
jgi:prepilin peptidase CpaA